MLREAGFSEDRQSSVSAGFFFFFLLRLSPSSPCNSALVILSSGLPHTASALGLVLAGYESSPRADLEAADPGSRSDS